ncbi:MAG TPA: hypothetical protein VMK13_14730, partial [Streptosporangiaceae bacterium]|nr:hypothetical protein [Streptosporangiaceae bacterium]
RSGFAPPGLDCQGAVTVGEAYRGGRAAGVAGAVGQRLLHDPVGGEVDIDGQRSRWPSSSRRTASPAALALQKDIT